MKLALYSDQIIPGNRNVDAALARVLPLNARIGYVPSSLDPNRRWFEGRRQYYAEGGWRLEVFHDPEEGDQVSLDALLSCDAIHLSGGDTAHFRNRLERAGMMSILREFALGNGVLIGTSAGAILLTPTIALDAIFRDADPLIDRGNDGLGLTEFEFFPHAKAGAARLRQVVEYTRSTSTRVLACPDGSGIVIDGNDLCLVGPGYRIRDGIMLDWSHAGPSGRC